MKKRFLLLALLLPILVLGGLAGALVWYADQPLAVRGDSVEVTLPRGTAMRQVAQLVVDGGVAVNASALYWMARLGGHAGRIKAGSYEIHDGVTPRELIDKFVRGDVVLRSVALIEGWTFRQVRATLDANPDLSHDSRALSDAEILRRIGAEETQPEGLFFPDTYRFHQGESDLDVLQRAYAQMHAHLEHAWANRADDLPFKSPYEALTLASIVEKETGKVDDRPLIASVFVNRLRAGMLLQTDPTIIYGLGERFDGNLRKRDLMRDSPYNTYTRPGLPPTPIAMPGLAALKAVLNPPESRFYYFVARGDGSSHFSRSLAEHNRAVREYQLK
ncbi:endolytic transglycosylase MltG [Nitrogeniibacter mangrovi]|uniref:Endolytic murein transglycosylase n=1 Tax=Nitrogeniibacter mangrovi TaxID=2016596 RepID=A0A6C1B2S5_9RHOO|nr:endolytic transglycosylase MltG [Nitrogeniibacter mangrovi]QID17951.1 endolytic transglycosylase MltG [Nitrogeniibacter mangrovi]